MKQTFKIIGLCGRSGSGKGYICEKFADFGIPSIDTDRVYNDIISNKNSECLKELVYSFGNSILKSSGELDRKALGSIVFSDDEKLKLLNSVTHKYILRATAAEVKRYRKNGKKAVVVDAPVLFESGFDGLCDILLCVTCPDEKCIERITERDGIDKASAENRLKSQLSSEMLRSLCDWEIVNNDVEDPEKQVEDFLRHYSLL